MLKREMVAIAVTGVELIGAILIGRRIKQAVDWKVQKDYGCRDTKDYLRKVDNGEIRMDSSAKRRVP